ncbi:MAG: Tex family protein [Kiritimatiellia bacterium]
MTDAISQLVDELKIAPRQIQAVAQLLAEGATIPFIARYRKEAHGNLDEVQIGKIQERLAYYRELDERRTAILKSIDDQGKLTEDLRRKIEVCQTKSALEDLYLPYKPKRRTRAMIAKENGLEPLAQKLLARDTCLEETAAAFVTENIPDVASALAGARDIVAEQMAEDADIRGFARTYMATHARLVSQVVEPKPLEPTKFEQYYDFSESVSAIPSHRYLAIRRGQTEGILRARLVCDSTPILDAIAARYGHSEHLDLSAQDACKRLLLPSVEIDVLVELKMKSDRAAVEVFAENLRNLLLAPPLGEHPVVAIDPGIRTGCKVVALDANGKFLRNTVIYLQKGDRQQLEARVELLKLLADTKPFAIAVGNGTGGRETESFVRQTLAAANAKSIAVVAVSESGASVYSASEIAREEFPQLDLTVRGAISIGRRLQDPLAELVKIDPKAIGVGQYQHDVHQPLLAAKLDEVVVSCVNRVGVELNTASAPLLTRVSGIGTTMAKRLVDYRDAHGSFKSRRELMDVPGLGPKTFEQAAGFLRIHGAANPLDASAVHPERYPLVEHMASDLGVTVVELIGNGKLVDKIDIRHYLSADVGEPTLRDILAELKKPGRDPRATFEPPAFRDDVLTLDDVKAGMTLEGIVTNVTAFGAFVDIGVHQDGLVHVSELSDHYISDPSSVVKTGDKLQVRVLSVDLARKRISLSARRNSSRRDVSSSRATTPRLGADKHPPRTQGGFSCNPFAGL